MAGLPLLLAAPVKVATGAEEAVVGATLWIQTLLVEAAATDVGATGAGVLAAGADGTTVTMVVGAAELHWAQLEDEAGAGAGAGAGAEDEAGAGAGAGAGAEDQVFHWLEGADEVVGTTGLVVAEVVGTTGLVVVVEVVQSDQT